MINYVGMIHHFVIRDNYYPIVKITSVQNKKLKYDDMRIKKFITLIVWNVSDQLCVWYDKD